MANVLLLVHRIPYPPNKGDKIRSYHLLKFLSDKHRVFTAAFVDDAADWQYQTVIEQLCVSCCLLTLSKIKALIRSALGIFTGTPLTLHYYRNSRMMKWVKDIVRSESIDYVVVFSSSMAQYIEADTYAGLRRIIDFVDVDSDKWEQYSRKRKFPLSWVYHREAKLLRDYERKISLDFDVSAFVSRDEAELFKQMVPESKDKVSFYMNGVDLNYFDKQAKFDFNPYPEGAVALVFVGAMDYWANEEAVVWFVNEVFPRLKLALSRAEFYIVGSNPGKAVTALNNKRGVTVTGRVKDVRPFLVHASATILSLRTARGIQNKVLEAMAMRCPVVASSQAIEGIKVTDKKEYILANSAEQIVAGVLKLVSDPGYRATVVDAARMYIEKNYRWSTNLAVFERWLS